MPIIKLSEVKEILGLVSDDSKDSLIRTLIPIVQSSVISHTRNYFTNIGIQIVSSKLSFVAADKKIILGQESFTDYFFTEGDYKITDSKHNDGVYEIGTISATELVVKDSSFKFPVDEAAENTITITKMNFPEDIKVPVALYIDKLIKKRDTSVVSESLPGGYSITYKDQSENSWLKSFNNWRKIYQ